VQQQAPITIDKKWRERDLSRFRERGSFFTLSAREGIGLVGEGGTFTLRGRKDTILNQKERTSPEENGYQKRGNEAGENLLGQEVSPRI